MSNFIFTSESVAMGHPDKIADQISDAILDACLAEDPDSRVACEVLVSTGIVILAGEITTTARPDFQGIARGVIKRIGYNDTRLGFDYHSCGILTTINQQSPDISQGVSEGSGIFEEQGAGDQGIMVGFACDETPELMPLPIMLAHRMMLLLKEKRVTGLIPYLRPDAKVQVTVEYTADYKPLRVTTVVLSTQHTEEVEHKQIVHDMQNIIKEVVGADLLDEDTHYYINPTGRFVIGGPSGDCGLTGRKITVDTYGGMARHGGGAFSGKDPSKVDRSATYAARYVAKNIVASGFAKRCEVQIAYAIGIARPLSIKVDAFGTSEVSEDLLATVIPKVFDLSPKGIIERLDLKRPIYSKTSWGGHFGREEAEFTWEKVDKVEKLRQAVEAEKKMPCRSQ